MKIVIATDSFPPRLDGVARFLFRLLPALCQKFELTILAPKFPGKLPNYPNTTIHTFPLIKWRFGDMYFARPSQKTIQHAIASADIVFNQNIGPIGYAALRTARRLNKKIISYVHSIDWELTRDALGTFGFLVGWIIKLYARWFYNHCTLLFLPSTSTGRSLNKNHITTPTRLIPLGVDETLFTPPRSKARAKEKVGIQKNSIVIGFCGRIAREKNLPTLATAFLRIHQNNHQTKLLIVGEGLANEIPKHESIIMAGSQQNVVPYLQAMDIFVTPSLTETSSLATMEALSCGIPVIATPVGALGEYIHPGKNGYLFPPKNVDLLAQKIEHLIMHPAQRKRMSTNARNTILAHYRWKNTVKKFITTLTQFSN